MSLDWFFVNQQTLIKKGIPEGIPFKISGGATQIRTGDKGFAVLCLTTWLWRRIASQALEPGLFLKLYPVNVLYINERALYIMPRRPCTPPCCTRQKNAEFAENRRIMLTINTGWPII